MELLKPQRLTLDALLESLQRLVFEPAIGCDPVFSGVSASHRSPGETLDFGKVYLKYGPAVRRVLKRRGVPDRELDDQVNNVFEKAFVRRATLRETSKLQAWLMSFAVNVALNGARKHDREIADRALTHSDELDAMSEPHSNPSENAAAREGVAQLHLLLESLTELERSLVILVYCEGLCAQEAAEACQVELNHARRTLARARHKLRTALARRQKSDGWQVR